MSKMKRTTRGILALGMAIMMTMAMVLPVWADVNPTRGTDSDYVTFTQNDTTQSAGSTSGNSVVDDEQSMTVAVNKPTKFVVSIPKSVSLTNTKLNEINKFPYSISGLDLAPYQILTVTFGQATLDHGHGLYSKKQHIVYGFADEAASKKSYSTEQGQISEEEISLTGATKNADDINAGNWAGTMNVTVSVTADTPPSP